MATSQNGWTVYESGTDPNLVAIPKIIGRVRKGDVATIFTALVTFIDENVEDVDEGKDEWGYSYRPIRGQSTGYSNHASGTAIDINAMQHPRGVTGTWSAAEKKKIRAYLSGTLGGVVRWGEDYDPKLSKVDGMHFEINAGAAAVKKIAEKLRGDVTPTVSKPSKVADQSSTNTPNGSTTFPDNYADLKVNGNFKSWEIGALQILLKNTVGGLNKQWDGKFGKLTITDFMTLLQRNGYYIVTPFAAKGVKKGEKLSKDGKAGFWFWVEVQRMLANAEGNRKNGKVYYDPKRYLIDGDPAVETYKGVQRWLNDNN